MNLKKKIGVILTGILLGMNILSVNCSAGYIEPKTSAINIYDGYKNIISVEATAYIEDFKTKNSDLYKRVCDYLGDQLDIVRDKINILEIYCEVIEEFCVNARKDLDALNFEPNSYEYNIKKKLYKEVDILIGSIKDSIRILSDHSDIMVKMRLNKMPLTLIFNNDNYKEALSDICKYFNGTKRHNNYMISAINRYKPKVVFPIYTVEEMERNIPQYMDVFNILKGKFSLDSVSDFYILVQADKINKLMKKINEQDEYINQLKKEQKIPAYVKEIKQNVDAYIKEVKKDLSTYKLKEDIKDKA